MRFPEDCIEMKIKPRALTRSIFLNLLVLFLIIYIAGPFIWVISASFQGENELLKKPGSIIPKNPTTDNYRYVFTGQVPTSYEVTGQLRSRISQEARLIAPALKNSFIIAISVLLINILFATPAAYAFARLRWKFRNGFYNFILGSRLMPAMAIAIPYYVIIQSLKSFIPDPGTFRAYHPIFHLVPDAIHHKYPTGYGGSGSGGRVQLFPGVDEHCCTNDPARAGGSLGLRLHGLL
jgi:ABC-type glycerol-3-phosphate transport system permease component